jgi:hypothetical protein
LLNPSADRHGKQQVAAELTHGSLSQEAASFAGVIGVHVAGLRPDAVISGFPVSLFITLRA